ncbi:unnamed protein product [Adineta steineri]|uniref:LolA-like domain-containing protein n=1 Tax=Adineta steineri TaxID=433720 RepID=A0A813S419_9BILA|nr:unnamed protein product [Adineta steineri]CAF0825609.1 unnamed protein product [Adineta steineri]CAF1040626.1 unnamed protein product [Adineta steineri]
MKQYGLFCLLILFILGFNAQDPTTTLSPDWNGDPSVCTHDPSTPSTNDKPLPKFPNKAEFALESVEVRHLLNITLRSESTIYQYIYNYDANSLIVSKNQNGFISVEHSYYNILKKSTYYGGEVCLVTDISTNKDMDGASAIQLQDIGWHIRPLNEFLQFSSNDPQRPIIRPKFLGQDVIRGIPVDKWQTCYVDKVNYRTVRRIWHFAQQNYSTATGPVGEYAVPIQALVIGSFHAPNGTRIIEFDQVFNVHGYRHGIMGENDALSPPKGVFCNRDQGQNLISLKDAGISWPDHFSVRVQFLTSRTAQWGSFHLYYDQSRADNSRRLRYDYIPFGTEDFISVIHEYNDNLTYVIDRRIGTCRISRGVDIPDVVPFYDPVRFFIKNEAKFIFNPPQKAWEYNGVRSCRDNTINCTILTTPINNFPAMVELDIGFPTDETWAYTNVEYGWSMRAPYSRPPPGAPKLFDYPVSLYLRMYQYRNPSIAPPFNVLTEDIEYEFYEMSHDLKSSDFDTTLGLR